MAEKVKIINNSATFMCPECVKARTVDMSKYPGNDAPVKVNCKCPCGHSFTVILEKRLYTRKEITIPGIYVRYMNGKEIHRGSMVAKDLSISGFQFHIHERNTFEIGEDLWIIFNLDDSEQSLIKKKVIVRNINEQIIGTEFCSKEIDYCIEAYLESEDEQIVLDAFDTVSEAPIKDDNNITMDEIADIFSD